MYELEMYKSSLNRIVLRGYTDRTMSVPLLFLHFLKLVCVNAMHFI